MARAAGTRLVFPTPEGGQWDQSRFRDRLWLKSVAAATKKDRDESERDASVFDGFNFDWLRHTAGSLMAVAGLDPAVASERMRHTDGGALFLKTYRHLYEGEKRVQAQRLEDHVRASFDEEGTSALGIVDIGLNRTIPGMGAPGIEPGDGRMRFDDDRRVRRRSFVPLTFSGERLRERR